MGFACLTTSAMDLQLQLNTVNETGFGFHFTKRRKTLTALVIKLTLLISFPAEIESTLIPK